MNSELIIILVSVLGICVLLPAFIVWTISRRKMYEAKKRTEIALAVLKENPQADIDEIVRKITPGIDWRMKLLPLLWVGLLFGIIAFILFSLICVVEFASKQGFVFICFLTALCTSVSIPSLVCYIVGMRNRRSE